MTNTPCFRARFSTPGQQPAHFARASPNDGGRWHKPSCHLDEPRAQPEHKAQLPQVLLHAAPCPRGDPKAWLVALCSPHHSPRGQWWDTLYHMQHERLFKSQPTNQNQTKMFYFYVFLSTDFNLEASHPMVEASLSPCILLW